MTLVWDYPDPFFLNVQVNSDHIDNLNHVNNNVYGVWCQEAAWAHSQMLGLGIQVYRELDRAMVIRHAGYDYQQAAKRDEQLVVGTWLSGCDGRLTLDRKFQIIRLWDKTTVLRAHWQLVCIQLSSGRPARMPPEFKELYGAAVVNDQ